MAKSGKINPAQVLEDAEKIAQEFQAAEKDCTLLSKPEPVKKDLAKCFEEINAIIKAGEDIYQ